MNAILYAALVLLYQNDDFWVRESGDRVEVRWTVNRWHALRSAASGSDDPEVRYRLLRRSRVMTPVVARTVLPPEVPYWPEIDRIATVWEFAADNCGGFATSRFPFPFAQGAPCWTGYRHASFRLACSWLDRGGDPTALTNAARRAWVLEGGYGVDRTAEVRYTISWIAPYLLNPEYKR